MIMVEISESVTMWSFIGTSLVYDQARNQLGTAGGAKSFLRGPKF